MLVAGGGEGSQRPWWENKEAFAIITSNDDGMDSFIKGVYYVDSVGNITTMVN